MQDVEEGGVARADDAVGVDVRMRRTALARDRVDTLHVLRTEVVQGLRDEADGLILAHAGTQEFGFPDEEAAFALQYGHGVGLSIWEKPIFSRLVSLDHPEVLEEGMVFALETYWPAADGWGAARIEEEVVVTADGCEVITKFPAEELLVAGQRYFTVGGTLNSIRDSQSHLNTPEGRGATLAP